MKSFFPFEIFMESWTNKMFFLASDREKITQPSPSSCLLSTSTCCLSEWHPSSVRSIGTTWSTSQVSACFWVSQWHKCKVFLIKSLITFFTLKESCLKFDLNLLNPDNLNHDKQSLYPLYEQKLRKNSSANLWLSLVPLLSIIIRKVLA